MNPHLAKAVPIAESIVALLYPFAEIVLHDLKKKTIAAIFNNFSRRKVGDDSLLENEIDIKNLPEFYEPYGKINWDGKKLKSTTSVIRNDRGGAVGLFCINLDMSKFDELQNLMGVFTTLGKTSSKPKELFSDDWREKINSFVHESLQKQGKTITGLTKEEKKQLVLTLHQQGAFRAKHAAAYVGSVLDISRATVYKYLSKK